MKNKTVKNFNKNNKKYYSRIIYYDYKNNILKKKFEKNFQKLYINIFYEKNTICNFC